MKSMSVRPLSAWNYYINNMKKVLPVMISIAIGVFLLYFMYIIGDSVINTAQAGYLDTLQHFTLLYSPDENGMDEGVLEQIKQNSNVEKIIKVRTMHTNIQFMGAYTSTLVINLAKPELDEMFSRMDLKLREGRMPDNKSEILMHWKIAANKGYKVGQVIGSDVDEKEQLSGQYTLVGIYDGKSQLTWIPLNDEVGEPSGVMVVAKLGKVDEMNRFLYEVPYEGLSIRSLSAMRQTFKDNMSIVYIGSTFIEVLMVLVLCITIGNTTYIHFYQRKRELGILLSVGYSRKEIRKRMFNELFYMVLLAFLIGVSLAVVIGLIMKTVYMGPTGSTMNLFKVNYVLLAAILPLNVLIFSLLPSMTMLMKVDKINIIEG